MPPSENERDENSQKQQQSSSETSTSPNRHHIHAFKAQFDWKKSSANAHGKSKTDDARSSTSAPHDQRSSHSAERSQDSFQRIQQVMNPLGNEPSSEPSNASSGSTKDLLHQDMRACQDGSRDSGKDNESAGDEQRGWDQCPTSSYDAFNDDAEEEEEGDKNNVPVVDSSMLELTEQILANARTWYRPKPSQRLEVITVKHDTGTTGWTESYYQAVLILHDVGNDKMIGDESIKMKSSQHAGKTRLQAVSDLLGKLETGLQPWYQWQNRAR